MYRVHVTPVTAPPSSPFSLRTKTFIVKHSQESANSRYQVHVSPTLIYCPCGHCFTYLLPCRHVMAANIHAFANTFQEDQFHPRWLARFGPDRMKELLQNQFWIKPTLLEAEGEIKEGEEDMSVENDDSAPPSCSAPSSSSSSSSSSCPPLPVPMYDPSLQQTGYDSDGTAATLSLTSE